MELAIILISTLVSFFAILGLVFFLIFRAFKKSKALGDSYQQFAESHGYHYEPAQYGALTGYVNKTHEHGVIVLNLGPYKDYMDYEHFPFNRGYDRAVAYLISGDFQERPFRSFIYKHNGGNGEPPGLWTIVAVRATAVSGDLPEDCFFEKNALVRFVEGRQEPGFILETLEGFQKYLADS